MNRRQKGNAKLPQPETKQLIDSFLKAVARVNRALLMLDYDGTIAPFHQQRDQAFPYPGVVSRLQQIVKQGHTRVVIVSGRDTGETLLLLGMQPPVELWGLHGLQRRRLDGSQETMQVGPRILDALFDANRWLGYQQLRHTAEFKTGSIAVHWRGLSDQAAEEVRARVLLGWRPIAERCGLNLLEFDGGVEICAAEVHKGIVVGALLDEMGPAVPAAFLGDDTTDEQAFLAIRGRGLSVLVRPQWRKTTAQAWLKPPDELMNFLARWLEASRAAGDGRESAAAGFR